MHILHSPICAKEGSPAGIQPSRVFHLSQAQDQQYGCQNKSKHSSSGLLLQNIEQAYSEYVVNDEYAQGEECYHGQ